MPSTPMPLAPVRSLRGARLQKHADYQRVYKAARKQMSGSMGYFYWARASASDVIGSPAPLSAARVGLTVGKVLGNAVVRNRIKRRMREAVRLHLDLLPAAIDVVLHPRRQVSEMEFSRLEREVATIFARVAAAADREQPQ